MSLDNFAITITGTPDQLAPITDRLTRDGHTIALVDLGDMLLECDMTDTGDQVAGHGMTTLTVPKWMADVLIPLFRVDGRVSGTAATFLTDRPHSHATPAEGAGNDGPTGGDTSPATAGHTTDHTTTTPTDSCSTTPEHAEPEPAPAIATPSSTVNGLDALAAELAADDDPSDAELEAIETEPADNDAAELTDDEQLVATRSAVLSHRIEALFRLHPDREWTAPLMFEHLPGVTSTGVISTALSTLTSDGRAIRVGRGRYRAIAAVSAPVQVEHAPIGPEPLRDTLLRILRCDPDPTKTWTLEELEDYTGDDPTDIHDALLELHDEQLLIDDPNTTTEHQAVPA